MKRYIVVGALIGLLSAQASALSLSSGSISAQRTYVTAKARVAPVATPALASFRLPALITPKVSGPTTMDGGYPGGFCPKC